MKFIIDSLLVAGMFVSLFPSASMGEGFTAQSFGDYGNITVMEVSGNYDAHISGSKKDVPRQVIAKEFFKTHRDEYDFLIVFSSFDFRMPDAEAEAFYLRIKNDVRGIGLGLFDRSKLFGSGGNLQGMIDMGNVSKYVMDPEDPNFEQTLFILNHEVLHRWGAHVRFKDRDGTVSKALLSMDQSHWSFLLDSGGSVLHGNGWQMKGEGAFTSIAAGKHFGPLDLYLMGLHDRAGVPPMLLIDNPSVDASTHPKAGTTVTGTPRWVTIDDVIAAEGAREPDARVSKRAFRAAFIFIARPGTFPGYELQGLEDVRKGWEKMFTILTKGLGLMEVALLSVDDFPSGADVTASPYALCDRTPDMDEDVQCLAVDQSADGTLMSDSSRASPGVDAFLKRTVDLDLTVKGNDLTFTPATVSTIPANIEISAVIRNSGRDNVSQARIVLYDGFPFRERMVDEKEIEIPGQSSVRVPFTVRITDGKQHRFYVSVDPENVVKESNESNNLAAQIFDPETTCDFVIRSSDISLSTHLADRFSEVKITAKVTNRGTSNAHNVQLRYTLGGLENRLDLATITADIPAGQTVSREITWRATRSGVNLPVTVSVDPLDSFQELSETNNRAVTHLTVQDPTPSNVASRRRPW
jgi:hypothetical protein